MALRQAHVLFKDDIVGVLTETPQGGSVFEYCAGWDTAIACALPSDTRRVAWSPGLHPVFQHLLPEGWLRRQQVRAGRLQEEDEFGILLRFGRDCIGAISIQPVDGQPDAPLPSQADAITLAAGAHRTVSGIQNKLLAWQDGAVFRPATDETLATFIAKFAPTDQPDLVRNELHSLRLATALLEPGQVTRFRPGVVEGIGPGLLIERFDRAADDGKKLRLEDFAQILVQPRGHDFRGKYESSYEDVAAAILRHSARPQIDLLRFFDALVVSLLIGNADAHLKNWALLETAAGLRLAPQYDLLNTLIYGGTYHTRTALAIGGDHVRLEAVDQALLLDFARRVGVPAKAGKIRLDTLRRRLKTTTLLTQPEAEEPDGFFHRYVDIVRNACARIL